MSEIQQLIVCTFDGERRATEVRAALQELDRIETVHLGNIAVVKKASDGEVEFSETQDYTAPLGVAAGALLGGLTDLVYKIIGGPGAVAGATVGAQVRTSVRRIIGDLGFPDDALRALGAALDAGHSALLALVRLDDAPRVTRELERLGGTLVQHELSPELVAALTRAAEEHHS